MGGPGVTFGFDFDFFGLRKAFFVVWCDAVCGIWLSS
jgi:hypothetical protein